jgi:3-methyladenine DNA glycosylase AlkD
MKKPKKTTASPKGKRPASSDKIKQAPLTARQFIDQLTASQSPQELKKNQRFVASDTGKCLGIRMKTIFDTAKEFTAMPLQEIDQLFDNPYYEVRMGAVSIMDFQARHKNVSEATKKALYTLYLKRHDRINNWDFVDRSAPHVIGGYLSDKPRTVLYKLAKSKNIWERRTAIVSTWYFIRQNDINDTFKIAEILVHDKEDLIHKAVGSWVREAGKRDKQMLVNFLNRHAATMPRVMLRYAIEKMDKKEKEFYMKMK